MLERLKSEIELAIFYLVTAEGYKTYEAIRDENPKALAAIKAMINAYNKVSQYYYKPEYAINFKTKEFIVDYLEEIK